MKIDIDFDSKKLQRGFVQITRACQMANARTLSTMAALSRKNAIKKISDDFILRNNFTVKQLQFNKAEETWDIQNQQAVFGATEKAKYLAIHNDGGEKHSKGKYLSIPTKNARGGSEKSLVLKSRYLKRILKNRVGEPKLFKATFGLMRMKKSWFVAMAYVAFRDKKYITNPHIYSVTSFSKSGNRPKFTLNKLYFATKNKAVVKPTHWMQISTEKPIRDAQSIYNSQISKLLKQKDII